jgi:5'(3')-deoxyribonucleotidase
MRLYIDLDGVITDFNQQLAKLLDKKLERSWDFGNDPKVWKKIDEAGEGFWKSMEWMPEGKELWDAAKKYNPIILTAPSRHQSSWAGKRAWLKENLPKVPYIIESKKEKHADKDSVLIDDREKNIKKWRDAGGIAIHHKDAKSTIKKLKEIMKDKDGEKEAGYSNYLVNTPKDGGEYYTLRIPKDVVPPQEGVNLNIDGVNLVVFSVSTPEDIAKGRGGPVAKSMIENGIGWSVNCLPNGHEYLRRDRMAETIVKLDDLADKLEALGRIKEAFHLDRIADRFEDFLKAEKERGSMEPGTQVAEKPSVFKPLQFRKYLWGSGDKKLQTVKEVLNNLATNRTSVKIPQDKIQDASYILDQLRKIAVTEFTSQNDIDATKKDLMNRAVGISSDVAELIGLLFNFDKDKMKQNEADINRLARKYQIQQKRDPFQTSGYDPFERTFKSLARPINKMASEGLSEEHKKLVQACLIKVAAVIEARCYKIDDYDTPVASNDKEAAMEPGLLNYLVNLIDYMRKGKRTVQDIANRIKYGKERWPSISPDKKKSLVAAWKEALFKVAKAPGEILDLVKSFGLTSRELEVLPFDLETWGGVTGLPVTQFVQEINNSTLKSTA